MLAYLAVAPAEAAQPFFVVFIEVMRTVHENTCDNHAIFCLTNKDAK